VSNLAYVLNTHIPDELPDFDMQFAPFLENKGFDVFHA